MFVAVLLCGCAPSFDAWTFGATSSASSGSSSSSGGGAGGGDLALPFCDVPDGFETLDAWDVQSGGAKLQSQGGSSVVELEPTPAENALLLRKPMAHFDQCAQTIRLVAFDPSSAVAAIVVFRNSPSFFKVSASPQGGVSYHLDLGPGVALSPLDAIADRLGFALSSGHLFLGYGDASGWHLRDVGLAPSYLSTAGYYLGADAAVGKTTRFDDHDVAAITLGDVARATK